MIVTVTPNPLLNYVIDSFDGRSGEIRCDKINAVAGGKGINVARMLKQLGQPALAMSFAGGASGEKLKKILSQESISMRWIATNSETRIGFDLQGCLHAWWLENGTELEAMAIENFMHELKIELSGISFLALSGTIPGKKNQDFYLRILEECRSFNGEIFVDARGKALEAACSLGGFFLKHNRDETMETFGFDPMSDKELAELIRIWQKKKIWGAMITDGGRDVKLWDGQLVYTISPAPVKEVSAVGCGDATLAGLIYGRSKGMTLIQASMLGLAAGAADAESPNPCSADFSRVQEKLFFIRIKSAESFG